jgi:hypothetical protein
MGYERNLQKDAPKRTEPLKTKITTNLKQIGNKNVPETGIMWHQEA